MTRLQQLDAAHDAWVARTRWQTNLAIAGLVICISLGVALMMGAGI